MIFVTVGTNEAAFDRLLRHLDGIAADEELVVQHGASAVRPPGATCRDFLPFDELAALMRRARVVVTHAGVGSIVAALTNGKRPVVVPRLARFGEAVDDHQVPLARRLAGSGLVTLVEDPAELPGALSAAAAAEAGAIEMDERLVGDLRTFIRGSVGRDADAPRSPAYST
jgi:UDP-N-acetylglucosamine transferase subunit ALG13